MDSIDKYLSAKSHLSIESSPISGADQHFEDPAIPIWKISEVEFYGYYDKENDHIEITELYAYDTEGYGARVKDSSYSELIVEWWPISDEEVYVDNIFFLGEEGFYIFSPLRELPIK